MRDPCDKIIMAPTVTPWGGSLWCRIPGAAMAGSHGGDGISHQRIADPEMIRGDEVGRRCSDDPALMRSLREQPRATSIVRRDCWSDMLLSFGDRLSNPILFYLKRGNKRDFPNTEWQERRGAISNTESRSDGRMSHWGGLFAGRRLGAWRRSPPIHGLRGLSNTPLSDSDGLGACRDVLPHPSAMTWSDRAAFDETTSAGGGSIRRFLSIHARFKRRRCGHEDRVKRGQEGAMNASM